MPTETSSTNEPGFLRPSLDAVKALRKIRCLQIHELEQTRLIGDRVGHKQPDYGCEQIGRRIKFVGHARRAGAIELEIAIPCCATELNCGDAVTITDKVPFTVRLVIFHPSPVPSAGKA
jgi:hypothetical protein